MDLVVCKDALEVARFADEWMARRVGGLKAKSVYLPAGSTPESLYRLWRETKPDYLDGVKLLQIDDVLTGRKAGQFKSFFHTQMSPWLTQFEWISNGQTQADLGVLGLGLNGHVAFHEPGLPRHFFSGCVQLSEETLNRLELEKGTWGITYGLGAFMRAKALLLMVTGSSKKEIFARFSQRRGEFPALVLREHPSLTVVVDHSVT